MSEGVRIRKVAGVLQLQFDRPDAKNAINSAMYTLMADALIDADTDPSVRIVLIGTTHDTFTSGTDLCDAHSDESVSKSAPAARFLAALIDCRMPIVAGVSGSAIGVGLTMLCYADIVIADSTARFRAPITDLALSSESSSSFVLSLMLGFTSASELLLSGREFGAVEAHQCGLASCLTDALAWDEADRVTNALAKKSPRSMRETKRLIRTLCSELNSQMLFEGAVFRSLLTSPGAHDALSTFRESREPDSSGQ